MRPGKDVGGLARRVLVHLNLYATQKFGDALHLVYDDRRRMLLHEVGPIGLRLTPKVGIFKVDIPIVGEKLLC